MHDVWISGMTISGRKTAIVMPGITIVGMVCDFDGRHPENKKVQKIVDWPAPRTVKEARGLIGLVVYRLGNELSLTEQALSLAWLGNPLPDQEIYSVRVSLAWLV